MNLSFSGAPKNHNSTIIDVKETTSDPIAASDGAERKNGEVAGFDYGALDSNSAASAQRAAQKIRSGLRAQGLAVIEVGRELLVVKALLQHGQFTAWLEAEFGLSERTAQRYMRVAEVFGAKADSVSDLPTTTLHQLAAHPRHRWTPSSPARNRPGCRRAWSRVRGADRWWRVARENRRDDEKVLQGAAPSVLASPARA